MSNDIDFPGKTDNTVRLWRSGSARGEYPTGVSRQASKCI